MDAQARIAELESQVRMLNQKASSAIDRWADYEQELHRLRAQQKQQQQHYFPNQHRHDKPLPDGPPVSPTRASILQAGTYRLSAMLSSRKSTPNLRSPDGSIPPPPLLPPGMSPLGGGGETHDDLRKALTREQSLRKEAEGRLTATSREVEELSVTLFEQANEMVAEERRARARLEERVGELERRDAEKKKRLERLEMAMGRIDRAKALLNEK
jgi:chromosome segregation ATPase